ncbi:uncharacterized protein LOC124930343 [Impatiens glandulifera]|uniref:uncharacterized protein LOC124930343 n=1 Tax=Impatiens glandulifera TaxID=253017 RepID=UPI001FB07E10|nr:uncharacterized protein LOC124930343 [Impatiens glandulifera]
MRSDRIWMYNYKPSSNQREFVDQFLNDLLEFMSFATSQFAYMDGDKIQCPCTKCRIKKFIPPNLCQTHLIKFGFIDNYYTWIAHGEPIQNSKVFQYPRKRPSRVMNEWNDQQFGGSNAYESMIFDIVSSYHANTENKGSTSNSNDIHILSERFWKALNAAHQPIWPGHPTERKLSATVKLLNIKSDNNWSERAVNENLDFIKSLLPQENVLSDSFYGMKKLVEDLGLPVVKIDVCRDGCMLFWKTDSDDELCKFCELPMYKGNGYKRKPYKQLFYLPLTPRLQRLYASNMTAAHMTWHAHHCTEDGIMCHPSDGEAWKTFDHHYPDFAREGRNVRLGLCSDGFAPFGQFGKPYSCWPVILTHYSLPLGMCMKTPYMFISLIVPGPKCPQKNIDIYLQPLVADLKILWSQGVSTYDVSRGDTFNMGAIVLWTISDFPAYGMLSGWSTHRIDGCPICMKKSKSFRLKYGRKPCYFDSHRQFLPQDHPYRLDTQHFVKNKAEMMHPPHRLNGSEIWDEISQFEFVSENPHGYPPGFGDSHKWTKKSIFWELPYWEKILIRHNLDFMHVEKNVFENLINTIMNVKGKTKDNLNARKDMFLICNRPELHIDPSSSFKRTNKVSQSIKRKVKNKARVEASICNAYILQEISMFASYYFESNVQCKRRIPQRNTEGSLNNKEPPISIFNYLGRSSGASTKRFLDSQEALVAHTYVLLNCPEVDPYYKLFCDLNQGFSIAEIDRQFAFWFRSKEYSPGCNEPNKLLYYLSFGPKTPASSFSIYFVNGFVWRPKDYGSNKSTMNSGVCVRARDVDYYGLVDEIIQLEYPGPCLCVVLFKCLWFDPTRGTRVDETYRIVEVNMKMVYASMIYEFEDEYDENKYNESQFEEIESDGSEVGDSESDPNIEDVGNQYESGQDDDIF